MNYILLAMLVIFNVSDVFYTGKALNLGVQEANPLADLFIQYSGLTGLSVFKGVLLGMLAILIPFSPKWITLALISLCVVYGSVVVYHINHL